jgi:hypothetical protein
MCFFFLSMVNVYNIWLVANNTMGTETRCADRVCSVHVRWRWTRAGRQGIYLRMPVGEDGTLASWGDVHGQMSIYIPLQVHTYSIYVHTQKQISISGARGEISKHGRVLCPTRSAYCWPLRTGELVEHGILRGRCPPPPSTARQETGSGPLIDLQWLGDVAYISNLTSAHPLGQPVSPISP